MSSRLTHYLKGRQWVQNQSDPFLASAAEAKWFLSARQEFDSLLAEVRSDAIFVHFSSELREIARSRDSADDRYQQWAFLSAEGLHCEAQDENNRVPSSVFLESESLEEDLWSEARVLKAEWQTDVARFCSIEGRLNRIRELQGSLRISCEKKGSCALASAKKAENQFAEQIEHLTNVQVKSRQNLTTKWNDALPVSLNCKTDV